MITNDTDISDLELNRLMPHMTVREEIRWSEKNGYHEHATLLRRLDDEEFERGPEWN